MFNGAYKRDSCCETDLSTALMLQQTGNNCEMDEIPVVQRSGDESTPERKTETVRGRLTHSLRY